jgi:transposase
LLERHQELEAALAGVNAQICKEVRSSPDPFVAEAVQLLDTIPGVGEQGAETIIAEIGVDMSRFPSAGHLVSWGGMCPGNNESAGKGRSGKSRKGSPYLRAMLVQGAWAAAHTKGTYLSAQFRRLVQRMGQKKALLAGGQSDLVLD